ncbi:MULTISPECIES: erythromycin esterase family protein [Anaerococcus]|uniref:erythromycin esterase family protein n=1 Tax=Anaerococcus TaxID=165779 RepID=UPI002432E751|nr:MULTISPECIES: erythromycin esterase family protein [Anaerococcus]MDD7766793.1 erythromycin esterase family protein [Anaerococcus vaginalis]MDY6127933.1 erythromycin esterase family protein [Anaerococcus sp.]
MKKIFKVLLYIIISISILGFLFIFLWTKIPEFKSKKEISDLGKYAEKIEDIKIDDQVEIIGLGEATHGNKEFQELKLDLLKKLVKDANVRAFALECDFSEGMEIDSYVKSGKFQKNPSKIFSFTIYHTNEMNDLINWIKKYNQNHDQKISFYGFDMQNPEKSVKLVKDFVKKEKLDFDIKSLDVLEKNNISIKDPKMKILEENLKKLNEKLEKNTKEKRLIENIISSFPYYRMVDDYVKSSEYRDKKMAENVSWIKDYEKNSRIMIAGHNGHIGKKESMYKNMGENLLEKYKKSYFTIGTDFYKTKVNIKTMQKNQRTIQKFISADPFAYEAKNHKNSYYLDFSKVKDGDSKNLLDSKIKMGSLGEGYTIVMKFVPYSYRIEKSPKEIFDSMIFVYETHPIQIIEN